MNSKILFYAIFLLFSCKKPIPEPTPLPEPNSIFPNLVWRKLIADSTLTASMKPVVYKDKVIFSKQETTNPYASFIALDATKGDIIGKWESGGGLFNTEFNQIPYLNTLLLTSGPRVYGVNLDNLTQSWRYTGADTYDKVEYLGKSAFVVLTHNGINSSSTNSCSVFRFDILTGSYDTLIVEKATNTILYPVLSLSSFINNQNDTILNVLVAWQDETDRNNIKGLCEFYTYNLRTKIKTPKLKFNGFTNDSPLEIQGDLLYRNVSTSFNNSDFLVCWNIKTGEEVWRKKIPRELVTTPIIYRDGKLFVNLEDKLFRAYDAKTGNELWAIKSGNLASQIEYYKGVFYLVAFGQLIAVDANTGVEKYRMEAPGAAKNSNLFFQSTMTLDEKNGKLYLFDFANAMCYQL